MILLSCSEEEILVEPEVPRPVIGINYYQLHQYDFDGKSEKHSIFYTNVENYHIDGELSRGRIANNEYTTVSNGNWDDSSTWSNDSIPPIDKITNIVVKDTVYGGDIDVGKESSLTVQAPGVLIIESLEILDKVFDLNVELGAVLIVRNNLLGKKDSNLIIDGVLLVGGIIEFGTGTTFINNSDSIYTCGTTVPTPTNSVKNCIELSNELPELEEVLYGTPLPITLAYQCATYSKEIQSIIVKWETASEVNSDYVIVKWSNDGYLWHDIDTVRSNNKPSEYKSIHKF